MSEIVTIDLSNAVEEQIVEVNPQNPQDEYDRFLADLWVGVALALMVLSCVGCLCTAFLYHAFKQWQRRVAESRHVEAGAYETESLPSYTLVAGVGAGLPSYEEAIERLKRGSTHHEGTSQSDQDDGAAQVFSRLSVGDLLEIYKVNNKK